MKYSDIILIIVFGILASGISILIVDDLNHLSEISPRVISGINTTTITKECTSNGYSKICVGDKVRIAGDSELSIYKVVGIASDDVILSNESITKRYNLIKD